MLAPRLGQDLDNENLQEVPLEENPRLTSHRKMFLYWVDNAFAEQIIPVFGMIAICIILLPYTWYAITRNKSCTHTKFVPMKFTNKYDSVNVDLSFNHLSPYKKFISVDIIFVRADSSEKVEFDANIMYEAKRLKQLHHVSTEPRNLSSRVQFEKGMLETDSLSLILVPTNSLYDVLDILGTIQSEYTGITGINVIWATADQRTYQFLTYGLLILFGVTVVCFHSYCITFKYFLYIENLLTFPLIGFAGASVNPMLYLFGWDIHYATLFIGVFAVYCKYHLLYKMKELEIKKSAWLQDHTTLAFFCIYLCVTMMASLCREDREILEMKVSIYEYVCMAFNAVYAFLFVMALKRARDGDEGSHPLRLHSLIGMGILLVVTDIVADTILPLFGIAQGTIYADMLRATAAYGYVCAFSMLFKRRLERYGIDVFNPSFNLVGEEEIENNVSSLLDE